MKLPISLKGEAEKEKDSAEYSLKKASKVIARNMAEKEKESVFVCPAEELPRQQDSNSTLQIKCDQCDFTSVSEKGLKQHTQIKHRNPNWMELMTLSQMSLSMLLKY